MISSLTGPVLAIRNDIAYGSTKVGMVGLVASREASYLIGQVIVVNGGNSIRYQRTSL